jgi:tetratricopeptide (TPR) repeat protein
MNESAAGPLSGTAEAAPTFASAPAFIIPPRRKSPGEWFAGNYDRIILALLIIQYVFVNLIFTTYTQNIVIMKDIAAPLLSLLIFGVWISGDLLTTGRWTLPRHGIVPAMVAALVYWGLLVPVGPSTASGVELWGRTCGYFIQTWAMIRFVTTMPRLRILITTLIVTNALMVFYGLTQIADMDVLVALGVFPDWGSHVFVSTHGSPNFFSGVLVATIPVFVGLWFVTKRWEELIGLPILILLNIFSVIESTNRSAYIALTIFLLLYSLVVVFRAISAPLIRRRICAAVMILVLVSAACVVVDRKATTDMTTMVGQQFYTFVDFESNYMNRVRLVFFQMALDGAEREPWSGRGMGSYNWMMPETRPVWYHRTGVSHNTDHAHNEHLEWLHDTGVPGLAFFWWILAVYLATGIRAFRRHRKGPLYPLAVAALFGPVNQWIQATWDVASRWTGNNVTLWFMVGFVMAVGNLSPDEEYTAAAPPRDCDRQPLFPSRATAALAVTALLAVVYIFYANRCWEADRHLRNNMAYTDGGGGASNAQAILEAEEARRLNYWITSNYYKLAYTYLVGNKLPLAMNAYRDLQSFAPNYAQIHINLAFLNDQLGYRTASAWERDRAATIEHNTRNHRDAANYWLQLGYPIRAIPHLRLCSTIELERNEAGYYYWFDVDNISADLARVYASSGRMDLAKTELERALRFNPNNLSAALLLTGLLQQIGESDGKSAAELQAMLEKNAADNPAILVLKMQEALAAKDYATVLELADRASSVLNVPGPGAQASQESQMLGNSILAATQVVFGVNFERPWCLEISGWIYACQGRYGEAVPFLEQAFMANHSPRTAERLGLVKARLRASSRY